MGFFLVGGGGGEAGVGFTRRFGEGAAGSCWQKQVIEQPTAAHAFFIRTPTPSQQSMLLALLVRSGCWLDKEAMTGRLEFRGLHIGGTSTPAVPSREGTWSSSGSSSSTRTVAVSSTNSSSNSSGSIHPAASASSTASSSTGQPTESSLSTAAPAAAAAAAAPIPPPVAAPAAPKGPARRPSKRLRRLTVSSSNPSLRPPAASGAPVYIDIALTGTKVGGGSDGG